MSRRLRPCRCGPGCTRAGAGCEFFHGTELFKSHSACRFGADCRFKEECVWLHPGEEHLAGRIFWRAAAPVGAPAALHRAASAHAGGGGGGARERSWGASLARAQARAEAARRYLPAAAAGGGAAARAAPRVPPPAAAPPPPAAKEPEPTGPPAPLDDYAILQSIKGFLVEKDYVALRRVSKALKGSIDSHAQMKKVRLNLQRGYALPPLDFVSELTIFAERHYADVPPRAAHLARVATAPMLEKVIFDGADPTAYLETLAHVRTIKVLIVRDFSGAYSDYTRLLVQAMPSWPGLVKLKLYKGINTAQQAQLLAQLRNCSRLKSLDLTLPAGAEILDFAPLSHCAALQSVALNNVSSQTVAAASQLKVRKLRLHNATLSAERMETNLVVKELHITNSVGRMENLRMFIQTFPELVTLNTSSIYEAALYDGDERDAVYRWPWMGLKKLKSLTAGSLGVKNLQFRSFCEQLPDGLEQLFIHGLEVTNFQPLIEQLRRFKLWSLGLNGNFCDAVRHTAACLIEFAPELQQLGFTIQDMSYTDARAAVTQFREFPGLRQLYIYTAGHRSTSLKQADISELRRLLTDKPTVLVSSPTISTHIKKKF